MGPLLALFLHFFSPKNHPEHPNVESFWLDKMGLATCTENTYEKDLDEALLAKISADRSIGGERIHADGGVNQIIISKVNDSLACGGPSPLLFPRHL
jgi:hypothetical protein